jgi:Zn-dependent peptidase ImmA (M78 family)
MANPNNLEFQINPSRLKYLLDLFKIDKEELLLKLQGTNINPVLNIEELNEIFENNRKVKVSVLKKLDSIFEKGINWYISKTDLPSREKLSIFFRKDKFNSDLSMGSIKKVEEFEKKKKEIEILCENINYKATKKLGYDLKEDPRKAAKEVREKFDETRNKLKKDALLKKSNSDKDFLENLIRTIEQFNVFVFEFTENWNKKDKANFNGFHINPNIIVIKRQQNYLKREIFTLMHEFAHYLLSEEEIDEQVGEFLNQGDIENWCNEFAYNFLVGEFANVLNDLNKADISNDFHKELLEKISQKTRISTLSLFTRLKVIHKISDFDYKRIYGEIVDAVRKEIQKQKEMAELERQLLKEKGEKPFAMSPKPIESKLLKEIVKINYFEGKISEGRVLESLNVKNNKSFEEVIYS